MPYIEVVDKTTSPAIQLREKRIVDIKNAVPAFKHASVCLILILMLAVPLAANSAVSANSANSASYSNSANSAVSANSANTINSVEIWAIIHSDGSAAMKEIWDIYIADDSNTEWFVAKHNLDNMDILDLSVQEDKGNGVITFETLGAWDENASRIEKAGKCGLLSANGGYDICWGFGELGSHKYTVAYTITNVVKGYQDGDAMSFNFLSDAAGGVGSLNIYLASDHFSFEYPATRIWAYGYSETSNFVDGGITILGNGRFSQSDYAAIVLAFDPGLLSPADRRAETLDEIISLNKERRNIWMMPENVAVDFIIVIICIFCAVGLPLILTRKRRKLFKTLRKAPYCQELPFEGNIGATYARLFDLNMANGGVIDCILLKWIQSGQVEIVTNTDYGEETIRLRAAKPDLPQFEASMYRMFKDAAGPDMVLRIRDFKKWAYKNHREIERWLLEYRSFYRNELVRMGVYEVVPVKRRLKAPKKEFRDAPLAHDMTLRAFGFKRNLEDFTKVNERDAHVILHGILDERGAHGVRDVHDTPHGILDERDAHGVRDAHGESYAREGVLPADGRPDWPFQSVSEHEARKVWDQYLVFAQLFGIADRVATQFKGLYANSAYQDDPRYIGGSFYLASIAVSNAFSQPVQQLHIGGFSGGGIGGFSGGGGAGGR